MTQSTPNRQGAGGNDRTRDERRDQALQRALAAVEAFYEGVIGDKDAEIARLTADNDRLAGLLKELRARVHPGRTTEGGAE